MKPDHTASLYPTPTAGRSLRAHLRRTSNELCDNEAGLSTVEYVVLLVLIGAVCIGTWKSFGEKISSELTNAESLFQDNLSTSSTSRR